MPSRPDGDMKGVGFLNAVIWHVIKERYCLLCGEDFTTDDALSLDWCIDHGYHMHRTCLELFEQTTKYPQNNITMRCV